MPNEKTKKSPGNSDLPLIKKALSFLYAGERGPVNLHEYRDPYERSLADMLPYDTMFDDGILLLKDGSFMASFEYSGEDIETTTGADRDRITAMINRALTKFGSGYTVCQDTMRYPIYEYLDTKQTEWPSEFARDLDVIRQKSFLTTAHYNSRHFFNIIFTPESPKISFIKKLLIEDNTDKQISSIQKTLKLFKNSVSDIASLLSSVITLRKLPHQEQLSYIHYCITGKYHPSGKFDEYCYLDSVLASEDFISGFKPKIGKNYLKMLSITGYPDSVSPDALGFLNHLPISFRWSNRFIILDEHEAIDILTRIRTGWGDKKDSVISLLMKSFKNKKEWSEEELSNDKNQDADVYEADVKKAMLEANMGYVKFGHYTSTIILYDENENALEQNARSIEKYFLNMGFIITAEDIHAEEAYHSSLPGNMYAGLRRPIINTENLACMLPAYSFYQGHKINPCPLYPKNSPALMVVNSEATTPFYFNPHVGDLGHFVVLGPTSAGKSTLLNLMVSQFLRYKNARVFLFDKKYSAYILTRTLGGSHIDILGPGQNICLTPFKYILRGKTEVNWATDYASSLCRMNGAQVTAKETNLINDAIQSYAAEGRIPSMSLLANRIQNRDITEALKFYTKAGAMGDLLDADEENLETSFLTTFETLHLMEMNEKVLNSVLLYLFHWIQNSLTGVPVFIPIDEGWSMLKDKMFKEEMRKWLKLLRSLNGIVGFLTQSVSDVVNSDISDVIFESCPTKILLPNVEAKNDISKPLYKQLGLSDGHIEIISSMSYKKDYLYMSPEGKRIMNLELDPYTLRFFNADMKNVEKARKIKGNFYEQWKNIDLSSESEKVA